MYNLNDLMKNGPFVKGVFYTAVGVILGLSGLGLYHFYFMKYLMILLATYFGVCGIYYSGAYHSITQQVNNLRK